MPDHPSLLQLYVWKEYDLAPDFPELRGFLDYWKKTLEGAFRARRPPSPDPLLRVEGGGRHHGDSLSAGAARLPADTGPRRTGALDGRRLRQVPSDPQP